MADRWLHSAARSRDIRALRQILDARPELVDDPDPYDSHYFRGRPLHHASDEGSIEAVSLLLDRGADINGRNRREATPLCVACESGHVEVVRYLLARGADPTLRDQSGSTPLVYTIRWGHRQLVGGLPPDCIGVVRLLLKGGHVAVDACDDEGRTAVYWACWRGWTEALHVLLVEGRPDYNRANRQGDTPMSVAQWHHYPRCIELLQWYEGELEKPLLLSKARAIADDIESISRAAEKVGAETGAAVQKAREEAAPVYLRGRVEGGGALPVLELVGQPGHEDEDIEVERRAVLTFVVRDLKGDLYMELMEGL